MLNQFSRSELLMGKAGVKQLKQKKIAVFGIGGVGVGKKRCGSILLDRP